VCIDKHVAHVMLLMLNSLISPPSFRVTLLIAHSWKSFFNSLPEQVAAVAKQLVATSKAPSDSTGSSTSSTPPPQQQQQQQPKLLVMSLLEGSQNRRQRAWAWAEPPHLVVANPTTLDKMLSTGGLRYNEVDDFFKEYFTDCLFESLFE